MKYWHIKFRARRVGAIGCWHTYTAWRPGKTLTEAKAALYDQFEHIHWWREVGDDHDY